MLFGNLISVEQGLTSGFKISIIETSLLYFQTTYKINIH